MPLNWHDSFGTALSKFPHWYFNSYCGFYKSPDIILQAKKDPNLDIKELNSYTNYKRDDVIKQVI